MSDPQVAVFMLGIFIFTILLGFPIAFTLVAMGVGFGFYAYYDPTVTTSLFDNRIFDLLVNQTYSVMSSDVLTAVPLFLFMGYIVERANIVDRLFFSMQIAARRLPGSMAIAALATCALFATATGIIGAVVTLMGLLALPAMLKAKYDPSFAAGVICAGGCLGILIPPSIMLIVYSATSNVSVVKLYAGAIVPGFMLAAMYMIYVIGRAWLNPKLAPKPPEDETTDLTRLQIFKMLCTSFFPLAFLILSVLGAILFGLATPSEAAAVGALGGLVLAASYRLGSISQGTIAPPWREMKRGPAAEESQVAIWLRSIGFGAIVGLPLCFFYLFVRTMLHNAGIWDEPDAPIPIPPLGITAVCLLLAVVVRVLGERTPVIGRWLPKHAVGRLVFEFAGKGVVIGISVGAAYYLLLGLTGWLVAINDRLEVNPWGVDIGLIAGLLGYVGWRMSDSQRLRESVYLTVRTSAMVCWLFVGSWTFASVFSYLGGHTIIRDAVLALQLSPVMFLIMAQLIIFLLGWPLEWSEIIIIFVPIFLPMLGHFQIDPLLFGILVALNLQTSFLTPPMAMAAYYLKGVAPPHVHLMHIFKGIMPFLGIVILAMIIIYIEPDIALGLPNYLYSK
ncbi:MAG TPA: TRAP transporter large permease subunit [Alphaproteobacteria bacterium]|nr:TRAP transporter large permease subunit [Alphaproteobacteria bacterium]